jgi:hypothetical protein
MPLILSKIFEPYDLPHTTTLCVHVINNHEQHRMAAHIKENNTGRISAHHISHACIRHTQV